MEVQLHLVRKGVFACTGERIWRAKLVDDGERCQDGILLIHSYPVDQPRRLRVCGDLQLFTLIKVHLAIPELIGRQHIEDQTDIRIGTSYKLINNRWGDLHLLPAMLVLCSNWIE